MGLIELLMCVLVVCVVVWAAKALLAAFGIGDPIRTLVIVIVVVLALVWLLQALGVAVPGLR